MPIFDSAGVPVHFIDQGTGPAVVLLHGFAASARSNWGDTGWIKHLATTYRVIAPDCRGHGLSAKPHDPEAYRDEEMQGDVLRLLGHLEIKRVLSMGYSMGALTALRLLIDHEVRFRACVLGGIGGRGGEAGDSGFRKSIVEALLAPGAARVSGEIPKMFRRFAEANCNDLRALAACMSRSRIVPGEHELLAIKVPTMVVAGTRDNLVGDPGKLAKSIPGAVLVRLQGRDHLNAVGDREYKRAVSRFFAEAPE